MEMSFKSIIRKLKEMKDGKGAETKHLSKRTRSQIVPDVAVSEPIEQGQWAKLPSKVLLDIIRRVEASETSWPDRSVIVSCASVCQSWRKIIKEIVKTPEECSRLTFPISLMQPGPRKTPIRCYIKRDKANSVYRLYFGMTPSEDERDKLLLAAKMIRRATSTDFVISLVADDFSRASNIYAGKLRSNFLGIEYSLYANQPPSDTTIQQHDRFNQRFHAKQRNRSYRSVATISYEQNHFGPRGPRRMHCAMHSILLSSIQKGGSAPTPKSFSQSFDEKSFSAPLSIANESAIRISARLAFQGQQ